MGENGAVSQSLTNENGGLEGTVSSSGGNNKQSEEEETDGSASSSSNEAVTFSLRTLTKQQKGLLLSICLTEFLIMCCNSLISPLLPPQANGRNVSGQMQGWIMASFAGGQFIIFPVFGKYVSKIGSKFMFLSGIFIAGGCTILMGSLQFVPYTEGSVVFEVLFFVLQIAMSVGVTAEQTAAFAVASKEFSGFFTTVFGVTEVFVGLGLTIGPLVGGVLSDVGGFSLPYFVLGGLVLSSLPFNCYLAPSIIDEPLAGKLRRKSGLSLLRHPSIIITCLAVVIGSGVWSVLDPCLEPHLEEFNLTPATIGAVFLLLSASYALSCALCGWIAEKLPDNRLLMIPGFILCGVAHCLLGPSSLFGFDPSFNQLWLIILALILLGAAMSMSIIPSYDIIMEIAIETGYPDSLSTHGLVAGLWSSMYALGEFIGPIWGGYIQDNIGFADGLTYTAGACVVIVILLTAMALYDCYCCEAEDDEKEIPEKQLLLPPEVVKRIRSLSEPMYRRGRNLTPVLETVYSEDFSSYSSSSSAYSNSIETNENDSYVSIQQSDVFSSNNRSDMKNSKPDATKIGINGNGKVKQYGSFSKTPFNPGTNKNGIPQTDTIQKSRSKSVTAGYPPISVFYPVWEKESNTFLEKDSRMLNSRNSPYSVQDNISTDKKSKPTARTLSIRQRLNNGGHDSDTCPKSLNKYPTENVDESDLISSSCPNTLTKITEVLEPTILSSSVPYSTSEIKIEIITEVLSDSVFVSETIVRKEEIYSEPDLINFDEGNRVTVNKNHVHVNNSKPDRANDTSAAENLTSKYGITELTCDSNQQIASGSATDVIVKQTNEKSSHLESADLNSQRDIYPHVIIQQPSNPKSATKDKKKESGAAAPPNENNDSVYTSLKVKVQRTRKTKSVSSAIQYEKSEVAVQVVKRPPTPVSVNPRDGIRSLLYKTIVNAPSNQISQAVVPKTIPTSKLFNRTNSNPGTSKKHKKRIHSMSLNADDSCIPDHYASLDYSEIYRNNMLP
ncbi:uncharacterized protein LOC126808695 [Patella vulgata]|uniref:uncharacterized protein LOC126808695 n=1 Tax=Patella vulgata TaxID=6465 RepID=UPI0024A84E07|nr:uncharacterized protein LOC126808695 [Patella vulgata]XP_050389569.2 uncharacterized protein LOC126808695 [Patella vulgata]XP_050389572.2 uncharacterized protein LOC126808695 [Patella vulgata]